MYIHEIKCQRCGEMAKLRNLIPIPKVDYTNLPDDTVSVELESQIECPKCGAISQIDVFRNPQQ
jgi:DNA-directed RNA polymerase subunit RPC12/RpoP